MRVVGCFLEYDGKFVILHRQSHKPDGNTWGLPGGKVEDGESDEQALIRELREETGCDAEAAVIKHLGNFDFTSSRGTPYTYVTYRITLRQPHEVRLEDDSHSEFRWVTAAECFARKDLISDFHNLMRLVGKVR